MARGLLAAHSRLWAHTTHTHHTTWHTCTGNILFHGIPYRLPTTPHMAYASPSTYPTRTQPHAASHSMSPAMHALHSHLSDSSAQHGAVFVPTLSLTAGASDRSMARARSRTSSPTCTQAMGTTLHPHQLPAPAQLGENRAVRAAQGASQERPGLTPRASRAPQLTRWAIARTPSPPNLKAHTLRAYTPLGAGVASVV